MLLSVKDWFGIDLIFRTVAHAQLFLSNDLYVNYRRLSQPGANRNKVQDGRVHGQILGVDQKCPKPGHVCFTHSFIHWFSEHLLNVYHVPELSSPHCVVESCQGIII